MQLQALSLGNVPCAVATATSAVAMMALAMAMVASAVAMVAVAVAVAQHEPPHRIQSTMPARLGLRGANSSQLCGRRRCAAPVVRAAFGSGDSAVRRQVRVHGRVWFLRRRLPRKCSALTMVALAVAIVALAVAIVASAVAVVASAVVVAQHEVSHRSQSTTPVGLDLCGANSFQLCG